MRNICHANGKTRSSEGYCEFADSQSQELGADDLGLFLFAVRCFLRGDRGFLGLFCR